MSWQIAIVGLLVGAAGWYLARDAWQTWRGQGKACGKRCCDKVQEKASNLIPLESVVLRSRDSKTRQ